MIKIDGKKFVLWFLLAAVFVQLSSRSLSYYPMVLFHNFDSIADGVIVESKITGGGLKGSKTAEICYRYVVDEIVYKSCLVDWSPKGWSVEDKMSSFPVGQVSVFYDSRRPSVSILNPSKREFFKTLLTHFISVVILILVFCLKRTDA